MNHIGFEFAGEVLNDEGIMGTLVDADAAPDAQAFGNVGFASLLIHDDAFLPVSNRWAEDLTFVIALLGLTVVFLQNRNTHPVTQPILSSVLFCFTCHSPGVNRERQPMFCASNESLEVLVSTDEADGARGGELHAGLAQSITGREVVLRVDLERNDTLATLHSSRRTDVLSECTAHALRHTVSTGTGGLLVLSKHMVGEGVDAQRIALGAGFLTDGGI